MMTLIHTAKRPVEKPPIRERILLIAGLFIILLVAASHVVSIDRQAPWEDEIFAISTSWSMARSQPPIMSVMAQYPRTGSPVRFYGPVSFGIAALEIRTFGLSMAVWRLTCFAGLLLTILVSTRLIRLAGGDKWAQLIAALILVLAGSTATQPPGRWDFITCGLFLSGLLLLLSGIEAGGRTLLWRAVVAGGLIGFAIGSTPRALTLCFAALVSMFFAALFFPRLRKNFLLGSVYVSAVAVLVHTLLLLPWGLNSFSWYAYVKDATKADAINATPMTGIGTWNLNLQSHKGALLLLVFLVIAASFTTVGHRRSRAADKKLALKFFLTLLALINLSLMMLLLANALGGLPYWMPLMVVAFLCWLDWESLRARRLGSLAAAVVGAVLLILAVQEARQELAIVLTWNRRSIADLAAFVQRTLPKDAVVYGPVGGYFYAVELAGGTYLYPFEHTTPGLYSEPHASIAPKLEEEICAHPTYVIWPEPDPPHQLWGPMPEPLASRVQLKSGEFRQPALVSWKESLLGKLGHVGGKYGFPDAAIYRLRSLNHCGKK
jgi:hypothetical protein